MKIPGLSGDIAPVLDPNIDEKRLESLYRQVSVVFLQLSKLEFPLIGALDEIDEWQWKVRKRPLLMPLYELVRIGTFTPGKAAYRHLSKLIRVLIESCITSRWPPLSSKERHHRVRNRLSAQIHGKGALPKTCSGKETYTRQSRALQVLVR